MLYLIATPIGNLKDITHRAIESLMLSDKIYCEDTRTSLVLLNHYEIKKPLESFHKFNEAKTLDQILKELEAGKTLSVISDAGTPGLADPGERLIQELIKKKYPFTLIPGASAPLMGLILSGFETIPYQFLGFPPKEKLSAFIEKILIYPHTTVLLETPHHVNKLLEAICKIDPDREMAIARELTKKFEEVVRGKAADLKEGNYRGEIVLIIKGSPTQIDKNKLLEEINYLISKGLSKKDAIEFVTRNTNVKKRDLYQHLI